MPKVHRLTRAELYDKVRQVPITRLADEFGLSDRGLSKLCERHELPSPPRGYRARLEAGQKVKKPALPELSSPQRPVIEIRGSDVPVHDCAVIREQQSDLADRIGVIEIPSTLRGLHPVVAAWVDEHRRDQEESRMRRKADRSVWSFWPVREDLSERDRYRFCVTSAFLKTVERQGGKVAGGTLRGKLSLVVCGEDLQCTIVEKMIQKPGYGQGTEKWTAYPEHHNTRLLSSGRLRFPINTWLDRNKYLVETSYAGASQILAAFVARVISAGPVLAERRRVSEAEAERRRIAMAERAERERLGRIDDERWAHFLQLADDRDRCTRLRAFVEELRVRALQAGGETDCVAAMRWIEWAEARITSMDPAGFPFERVFRLS